MVYRFSNTYRARFIVISPPPPWDSTTTSMTPPPQRSGAQVVGILLCCLNSNGWTSFSKLWWFQPFPFSPLANNPRNPKHALFCLLWLLFRNVVAWHRHSLPVAWQFWPFRVSVPGHMMTWWHLPSDDRSSASSPRFPLISSLHLQLYTNSTVFHKPSLSKCFLSLSL